MKYTIAILLAGLISAVSASAQTVATWIIPANTTTNYSIILAPNQVMEVLTLSVDDTTTTLGVTVNNQTINFGQGTSGGTEQFPVPLVIAGPATVTYGRSTSSSEGSLLTYRVSQYENQTAAPAARRAPATR